MSILTFRKYQSNAVETAIYPDKGNNIYYPALGLGEAGEVQNKIKKVMRDHNGKVTDEMLQAISGEIGDVLWYIAALCTELGLDMETIALHNIQKLKDRKARSVLKGSGDKR